MTKMPALEASFQRIPTGVRELDDTIEGGFPKGSLILLAGTPGSGKTAFAGKFLFEGIGGHAEKGVYASLAEGRDAFFSEMGRNGFDFRRLEEEGKFAFLDLLTAKSEAMSETARAMVDGVLDLGAARLVIDSFSAMGTSFS